MSHPWRIFHPCVGLGQGESEAEVGTTGLPHPTRVLLLRCGSLQNAYYTSCSNLLALCRLGPGQDPAPGLRPPEPTAPSGKNRLGTPRTRRVPSTADHDLVGAKTHMGTTERSVSSKAKNIEGYPSRWNLTLSVKNYHSNPFCKNTEGYPFKS